MSDDRWYKPSAPYGFDRDAHEAEVEYWRNYYREHPDER